MCSLFGSPDRNVFVELAKINEYRGSHSHSVAIFDHESVNIVSKQLGAFQMPAVVGEYYLGHAQAPTTDAKSAESVHPSEINDTLLWHNGIIKDHQIRQWQQQLGISDPWDTKLLHRLLSDTSAVSMLGDVDGSFACVWWDGQHLYLFRNTNCPLFTDDTSYSSTKFSGSYPLEPNIMYKLTREGISKTDITFATKNDFYWSPEE